jgi:hypothetical protein
MRESTRVSRLLRVMTRLLLGGGGVDPYVLCWVHVIDKLDMRLVRTKE